MTRPIEQVIAVLQRSVGSPSEAMVHDIVKRAYRPEEPTTKGTIVVLYDHLATGHLMAEDLLVMQLVGTAHVERWWDANTETYRTWEWICERDGEKRVFVPTDSLGDGCCAVDGPCRNGCVSS
jgi:hypothetical protein